MGQLDKLNDRSGLCPFDSKFRSLSDTSGEVLVQLDIRTVLMGWPTADANESTLDYTEGDEDTCRLLAT